MSRKKRPHVPDSHCNLPTDVRNEIISFCGFARDVSINSLSSSPLSPSQKDTGIYRSDGSEKHGKIFLYRYKDFPHTYHFDRTLDVTFDGEGKEMGAAKNLKIQIPQPFLRPKFEKSDELIFTGKYDRLHPDLSTFTLYNFSNFNISTNTKVDSLRYLKKLEFHKIDFSSSQPKFLPSVSHFVINDCSEIDFNIILTCPNVRKLELSSSFINESSKDFYSLISSNEQFKHLEVFYEASCYYCESDRLPCDMKKFYESPYIMDHGWEEERKKTPKNFKRLEIWKSELTQLSPLLLKMNLSELLIHSPSVSVEKFIRFSQVCSNKLRIVVDPISIIMKRWSRSIKKRSELVSLDLSNTRITEHFLAWTGQQFPKLKNLSLVSCNINGPNEIPIIVENFKNLKSLNLSKNDLLYRNDAIELKKLSLTKFIYENCTDREPQEFIQEIITSPTLIHVKLGGKLEVKKLFENVRDCGSSILCFDLSYLVFKERIKKKRENEIESWKNILEGTKVRILYLKKSERDEVECICL